MIVTPPTAPQNVMIPGLGLMSFATYSHIWHVGSDTDTLAYMFTGLPGLDHVVEGALVNAVFCAPGAAALPIGPTMTIVDGLIEDRIVQLDTTGHGILVIWTRTAPYVFTAGDYSAYVNIFYPV